MKARLSPDAWLLKETKIFKFSCIVAKEIHPYGPIKVNDMREAENYG
jgi:AMMECR1 domain-containing protein